MGRERGQARLETATLALEEGANSDGDRVELLLRREPVLAGRSDSCGRRSLQGRDDSVDVVVADSLATLGTRRALGGAFNREDAA